MIERGDCLEVLKILPDNSFDSLVTDPPAGISFMGKDWDSDKGGREEWTHWLSEVMREVHRVLKPGAHGLVWSIPRTSHWTAMSLEIAGFEIRDCITHLFGSGFPKSLDVSKAIDKAAGAERKVVGRKPGERYKYEFNSDFNSEQPKSRPGSGDAGLLTAPATDAAKQWQGFGTALKPAAEFWWLVRKPLSEKTVAANVLKWGTGAINIDGTRIPTGPQGITKGGCTKVGGMFGSGNEVTNKDGHALGRFPANLVLSHHPDCLHVFPDGSTEMICVDDCACKALDEQSGPCKTGKLEPHHKLKASSNVAMSGPNQERNPRQSFGGDSGGASRFFYCAKVSPSERNAGLEGFPEKECGIKNDSGRGFSESDPYKKILAKNNHPTVKPLKLMRYLCKLVTPPGGHVLDPFAGSGSTGVAAKQEGFLFTGIEMQEDYAAIAEKRMAAIQ